MEQIYDYLYANVDKEPGKLIQTVSRRFKVDVFEANRIYDSWKQEYMEPKHEVSGRAILREKGSL